MSHIEGQNLISSKEILKETGISRATLNNYIKMGIIPRPIVRKSIEGFKNIKNLGYFPRSALERIEEVKRLKKRGHSMRVIPEILNEEIRPHARYETDSLTDVYNQRHFYTQLKREIKRAERKKYKLALIMFDIDDFKSYDDEKGHLAGDDVLRKVGTIVKEKVRQNVDSGYRYGGDKFAIILINAGRDIAQKIGTRIKETIKKSCNLKVSMGHANFSKGMTLEKFIDEIQEIKKIKSKKEMYEEKLKLTIEEIPFPAYLINFDFEIVWINHEAEEKILNQKVGHIEDAESRNIFKLLFKWEFHWHVQNWKDLIAYHISFAKFKFSKILLARLYKEISSKEVDLLEKVYDDSSIYPDQLIKDTRINLLRKDGSTEQYRVYSMFFREGIFFVYVPVD